MVAEITWLYNLLYGVISHERQELRRLRLERARD